VLLVWLILTVWNSISTYYDFAHGHLTVGIGDILSLAVAAVFLGFEIGEAVYNK
jgi:hypothetical protein